MLIVSLLDRGQGLNFTLFIFHQIIKHAYAFGYDDVLDFFSLSLRKSIEYHEYYFYGAVTVLRKIQ
jgi:hypothetical protein